ncbi:MAG: hypothetical protein AAF958_20200 [Planctomycetota bacterium]
MDRFCRPVEHRYRASSLVKPGFTLVFACAVLTLVGCTTPAQRDVYQRKLANEVRVLEDQLYEADYENRVLREKLDRCQNSRRSSSSPPDDRPLLNDRPMIHDRPLIEAFSDQPLIPTPVPDAVPTPDSLNPAANSLEAGLGTEWAPEDISLGTPVTPDALQVPDTSGASSQTPSGSSSQTNESTPQTLPAPRNPPSSRGLPSPPAEADATTPLTDPPKNDTTDANDGTDAVTPSSDPQAPRPRPAESLPRGATLPPGGPMPPAADSLQPQPLIRDSITPPPSDPFRDDEPPGKIEIPDTISQQRTLQLRIHPLHSRIATELFEAPESDPADPFNAMPSGDGKPKPSSSKAPSSDVQLVMEVLDDRSFPIDWEAFDFQARLSVTLKQNDQVLAIWNFNEVQTAAMVGRFPVSGLHVPLRFGKRKPEKLPLQVQVELRGGDETMRAEAVLEVDRDRIASGWQPRG